MIYKNLDLGKSLKKNITPDNEINEYKKNWKKNNQLD